MEHHEQTWTPHAKASAKSVLSSIARIAAATNVALREETVAVYLERLICLSPERLTQATNRTIEDWKTANRMPPLPFIVERSYIRNEGEVSNDTPRILNQHQLLSAAREKVSHEQVLEWLETGKAKQRAYYAELIEDPAWQAMYERLSGKAPSTIPDDPVERKKWATDMAKKQGWL